MENDESRKLNSYWDQLTDGRPKYIAETALETAVSRFHALPDAPEVDAAFRARLRGTLDSYASSASSSTVPGKPMPDMPFSEHTIRAPSQFSRALRSVSMLLFAASLLIAIGLAVPSLNGLIPFVRDGNPASDLSYPAGFQAAPSTPDGELPYGMLLNLPIDSEGGLPGSLAVYAIATHVLSGGETNTFTFGSGSCCPWLSVWLPIDGDATVTTNMPTRLFVNGVAIDVAEGSIQHIVIGSAVAVSQSGFLTWSNTEIHPITLVEVWLQGGYESEISNTTSIAISNVKSSHQQVLVLPRDRTSLQIALTSAKNGKLPINSDSISSIAIVVDDSDGMIVRDNSGGLVFRSTGPNGLVVTALLVAPTQSNTGNTR